MHEHYFCSNCGYTGDPLVRPAGNAYVELLLWLIPIIFLINAKYPFLWLVVSRRQTPLNSPLAAAMTGAYDRGVWSMRRALVVIMVLIADVAFIRVTGMSGLMSEGCPSVGLASVEPAAVPAMLMLKAQRMTPVISMIAVVTA